MPQTLGYLKESASQTAGPHVHIGLAPGVAGCKTLARELGQVIASEGTPGERIRIEDFLIDGTGAPVNGVLIEVWQADAAGIYPRPEDPGVTQVASGLPGWGRIITDHHTGLWVIDTVKPGPVPGGAGRMRASNLNLWLVARDINIGLATGVYSPEDEAALAADPVPNSVESPARRKTLVATGPGSYGFDIRLPGDGETVFIDV